MATQTSTYAVDNTAEVQVRANSYCMRITVQENYDSGTAPTADLIQAIPFGGNPVKIAMGTPAIYTKGTLYSPGESAGSIKTRTGSITVQQVESGQI